VWIRTFRVTVRQSGGSAIPKFWLGSSLGFTELRFGVKVRDWARMSTVIRVSCSVSAILRISEKHRMVEVDYREWWSTEMADTSISIDK